MQVTSSNAITTIPHKGPQESGCVAITIHENGSAGKTATCGRLILSNIDDNIAAFLIPYLTPKEAAALRVQCRSLNKKFGSDIYYLKASNIFSFIFPPQIKISELGMPALRKKFIESYQEMTFKNTCAKSSILPKNLVEQYQKDKTDPIVFHQAVKKHISSNFLELQSEYRLWRHEYDLSPDQKLYKFDLSIILDKPDCSKSKEERLEYLRLKEIEDKKPPLRKLYEKLTDPKVQAIGVFGIIFVIFSVMSPCKNYCE